MGVLLGPGEVPVGMSVFYMVESASTVWNEVVSC